MRLHSVTLRRGGESGKVHMRGQVLFSWSLIGAHAHRVLAICADRVAVASGELLGARIAVVDGEDKSSLYCCGETQHILLRDQRGLNALRGFWMDAVAIKEI